MYNKFKGDYMKKLALTLIIVLYSISSYSFFGNEEEDKERVKIKKEFLLTCSNVGGNLIRCENKEVICYGGHSYASNPNIIGDAGVSCKFK